MKKYSLLLLPAFLILTACTVRVQNATPIPREEYREEYYYTFRGQILSENGTPMSNIGVTMEEKNLYSTDNRDGRFMTAKTDNAGNFSFTVKRNKKGIIRISDELLVNKSIQFKGPADSTPYDTGREDFSVLLDEGTAYQHATNIGYGNALEIRVPYSGMGFAFNEIKRLYERDQNYKEVINESRSFLETFRNNSAYVSEVRWMAVDSEKRLREKMRSEFDTLMALNERRDFESVIYKGKDYIGEYRGVRDSRWEEVRNLVDQAEHSRREAEYYRHEHESEAGRSRHEIEAREKYKAIMSLKETDYDAIISQGKAYIEEYGDLENGHSREVEKLVSTAEAKKKLAEEREKELERQERVAKEQVAKEQVAKEQVAREQVAIKKKDVDSGAGAEAKKGPAEPVKAEAAGGAIFKVSCASCHGSDGKGTPMAPAFKGNAWVKSAMKGEIADTIRNGRQGSAKKYKKFGLSMPPHKDMPERDVNALVDYLKSIN